MSEFNEIAEIAAAMSATTTSKGQEIPNTELAKAIEKTGLLVVKELKTTGKVGFYGTTPVARAAKISAPAETTAGVKKCCEELIAVLHNCGLTE